MVFHTTSLWRVLQKELNHENPNLDINQCDMHLLDTSFADLLNRCMGDMLDEIWKKGFYRDVEGVIV